jgi:hypothetical protein
MSKAYKEICPCRGCEERTITCHSSCYKYKDWQNSGIEIKKNEKLRITNFALVNRRK